MATATHEGAVPIEGYDKLEPRHLFPQLRLRSQAELKQIDEYERSNQGRRAVLDKLRYLRLDEPLDGYDALDSDEVLTAAADADIPTLGAIRNYESKLRAREPVLSGVAKLRAEREREKHSPGDASGDASAEAGDDSADRFPGDSEGGLKSGLFTIGMIVMIAVAACLMVVLLGILAFVLLTAVAPDVLITN